MRGKKTDVNFISEFITKCVARGISLRDEIVNEAKMEINIIDNKIKEAEKLKIVRSKLVDVVFNLEDKNQTTNTSESEILSFFKIKNQNICKFICNALKDKTVEINYFIKSDFNSQDVLFAIKQLVEHKIINNLNNYLIKGPEFDKYLKFVLLEE